MKFLNEIGEEGRFVSIIENQIQQISDRMSISQPNGGYMNPKLYFLTSVYNETSLIMCPNKRLEYVEGRQKCLFMRIMGATVSRYMKPKNRYKQPVSIDFFDFPGTRRGGRDTLSLPHVHSVLLIHPETDEKFNQARTNDFWIINRPDLNRRIRSLKCLNIETKEDLTRIVGYSSKFFRNPTYPFNQSLLHERLYNSQGGEMPLCGVGK
ncbi:hypothetical protein [Pseudophaeobacter leonis]|uniref:hypothetical protein n=1 Tax=Pseudophaeobacter leonis TaxID=1144477 RepID=UPI00111C92A9|nr:hypothetical protein [Pseudophaeobacter leonis]